MKKMLIKTRSRHEFIDLFSGLSKSRLELLWQIKQHAPESVYELSIKLNKSQPFLKKEIEFLAQKGLIALNKSKMNGRTRIKPEVLYKVLSFEVVFDHE